MISGAKRHNVALVTDYFYPSTGGVETHVRTIGEELAKQGHSVIVITHKNNKHVGRMRIGGMIVYYLDIPIITRNTALPTLYCGYLLYKSIFDMHDIDIVHGHQTMSTMCMEAIYHANHLNIKTVLTDHSVFEFGKFERIICDAISYYVCKNLDRAICVSNIAKINTSARTRIPSENIRVIPNGITPSLFYPKKMRIRKKIKVLFCARLVFRKGIDLLIQALPIICRNPDICVMIVGGGPKQDEIEQMLDEAELRDQVEIKGEMDYRHIPDLMRGSDIFLNTSLTETFCTSILEAASCGLLVVSTNVGGVHEVLEDEMIYFCRPTPEDIAAQIFNAARDLKGHSPDRHYKSILEKYDWKAIATRTAEVYDEIPAKDLGFEVIYRRFCDAGNFLHRLGTWAEFLQIRIFKWCDQFFAAD